MTAPDAPTVSRRTLLATGAALPAVALAARLSPALAAPATPAAAPFAGSSGGLGAMLGRVPLNLPGVDELGHLTISYADVAAQLVATGVAAPDRIDAPGFDAWQAATRSLLLPSAASQFLRTWRDDYGFDLLQADQTLAIEMPPFHLALLRGRFDEAAIRETLAETGYRPVEVGGHELLSLRGDYEQDIGGPVAYPMAGINFVAFLGDGTLTFASAGAPLAAALDLEARGGPSMLAFPGVRDVVANAPDGLASALLVSGLALAGGIPPSLIGSSIGGGTPDLGAIATEMAAARELPPVLMALLCDTVGGPLPEGRAGATPVALPAGAADARAVAVVAMADPESARVAVPIVEERLATGQSTFNGEPYATSFPAWSVSAVAETPVLVVDLTLGPGVPPTILVTMLFRRDLGFLAW